MAAWSMEMMKEEAIGYLTDEHSEEQRERFQNTIDAFIEESRRYDNTAEWVQQMAPAFSEFMEIGQDRQITVEESQRWCDKVEALLAGEEESPDGEEADQ